MKKLLPLLMTAALPFMSQGQTIYEEQFTTGNGLKLSGSNFAPFVTFEESSCGEVKITDAIVSDENPGAYKPMIFTPRTACGSNSIGVQDASSNLKVVMRVRGEAGLIIGAQLVDNGSPAAKTVRVQHTLVGGWDYEDVTFEFDAGTADEGFDATQIKQVYITLDPVSSNTGGWTGDSLYIDHITIGDATGEGNATCKMDMSSFGNGQEIYSDQFDNVNSVGLGGEAADAVIFNQTAECGYLSVKNNPEGLALEEFKPLIFQVKDSEGSSSSIDITGNEKVVIKAKAVGAAVSLRVDLKSVTGDNSTNGCGGKKIQEFPADEWIVRTYEFPASSFFDADETPVDASDIKGLNLFFLGGDGIDADSIIFDYIALGEAPTVMDPKCSGGVGLAENIDNNLSLFPNPVEESLQVEVERAGILMITNQVGMLVLETSVEIGANSVDLSTIEAGFYMARVQSEDGRISSSTLLKK